MKIILEDWALFTSTDSDKTTEIKINSLNELEILIKEKTLNNNSCFLIYDLDDNLFHIVCDPNIL